MKLKCQATGKEYTFISVPLAFEEGLHTEVFGNKNNKSLLETLEHHRYAKFRQSVEESYPGNLNQPLGEFLLSLKQSNDLFYRKFLNKYGDDIYSIFKIDYDDVLNKRGIYAYCADGALQYIGRCRDTMRNRVNQGYGKIHPKNCYIDGQATNCHLNALITKEKSQVQLWFCELELSDIETTELALIREYQPEWNIQR